MTELKYKNPWANELEDYENEHFPELTIDPEFQALIPPLTEEESSALERSLVENGCQDRLKCWEGDGGYLVLLDGHNRYRICRENGIRYGTQEVDLPDRAAAADWIDQFQLARRNLTPDQASLIRGRRYNRAKGKQGGTGANQHTEQTRQNVGTAQKLATQHGVNARTIERDGKFAEAVETVKAVDPDIEAKVTRGEAKPKSQIVEAARILEDDPDKAQALLSGDVSIADYKREKKRKDYKANLENVAVREVKAAKGVYDVIVIDPPWPMKKIERDVRPNQTEFDYPTMTVQEMWDDITLPVAGDCHVWVWATHKFLEAALGCMNAWGVKYVCTFVWHKPGGFQPIGLPQYNCEFALYGRRGSPKFVDTKAFNTCFTAPRGKHSEKPEEFYATVRRVTAGRRLDMFNRREIEGFDGWGNESA